MRTVVSALLTGLLAGCAGASAQASGSAVGPSTEATLCADVVVARAVTEASARAAVLALLEAVHSPLTRCFGCGSSVLAESPTESPEAQRLAEIMRGAHVALLRLVREAPVETGGGGVRLAIPRSVVRATFAAQGESTRERMALGRNLDHAWADLEAEQRAGAGPCDPGAPAGP